MISCRYPAAMQASLVTEYKTSNAKPYTHSALAGYAAEQYSIGLTDAWDKAKKSMIPMLRTKITENESATYHSATLNTSIFSFQCGSIRLHMITSYTQ